MKNEKELRLQLENLIIAAQGVVDNWSEGDLSGAVNGLEETAEEAKTLLATLKPEAPHIIITLEGGLVQDTFILDPSADKGFREIPVEVIDYDIFDGTPAEEIADYWNRRSDELKAHFKNNLPEEYERFQEFVLEANGETN